MRKALYVFVENKYISSLFDLYILPLCIRLGKNFGKKDRLFSVIHKPFCVVAVRENFWYNIGMIKAKAVKICCAYSAAKRVRVKPPQ